MNHNINENNTNTQWFTTTNNTYGINAMHGISNNIQAARMSGGYVYPKQKTTTTTTTTTRRPTSSNNNKIHTKYISSVGKTRSRYHQMRRSTIRVRSKSRRIRSIVRSKSRSKYLARFRL